MNEPRPWHLNHETREIIDCVALEYDGYAIKKFIFTKSKDGSSCCDEIKDGWTDFTLHRDRYFLRSELFGFQRYFGKWGGERTPEWDREYSFWYFVYLQSYRVVLPSLFREQCPEDWTRKAAKREEAAADLRRSFSLLGKDDLVDLSMEELEEAMRTDFTAACERGLEGTYIANRPTVLLANACDHERVLRLMDRESWSLDKTLAQLDLKAIVEAFGLYVNRGVVHEDDNVNRVIYKMLQWFVTKQSGPVNYVTRSHILYGLMYLHLYRTEFPRFAGIPERVAKWNREHFHFKEFWASRVRESLSTLREASSMLNNNRYN